ncbi:hypothetical protein QLQ12_30975 [Actinoplanes sp. NEAU-A12]|uniref:Uncharacterized protein n=1 Tax=Actinoplanes sandaracinus TaxID=3045177 RepID=A0ABT6WTH6_9ACTN|nr:hypothetical protein [Actinoplanes sandaracinus]MDI6103047.1 hypothetical protein [Actinoplanes sandaracinus]
MSLRAPDGRTLTIDGTPGAFLGGWAFMLWVDSPEGTYRLHTGTAGSTELVTKQTGEFAGFTVREVSWKGARLQSFEDTANNGTTVLWIGAHHELSTFVAGTSVPLEPFMDRLSKFDIQDSPEGIVLTPRPGSGRRLRNMLAANTIRDVCSLTVKPVEDVVSYIPKRAGKKVRGGQLWRTEERDTSGSLMYRTALIANETTATVLTPVRDDDPRLIEAAESVNFSLK